MRLLVAASVLLLGGCNALTGVGDLEEVPCTTDCVDSATVVDSAMQDTSIDTAAQDTGVRDTGPDVPADTFVPCKVNKDCDDKDDCTRDTCDLDGGTCSSAKIDEDMDGESPSSAGACGMDCDDTNKSVFSKQTAFFPTPYLNGVGTNSYDYDCNGVEEKEKTAFYKCVLSGPSTCTVTEGWTGSTAPACGATGNWVKTCTYTAFTGACTPALTKLRQGCR